MPAVTLLVKAYNNSQLSFIEKFFDSKLKGLNVETKICGVTQRGWVQIAVSGEDENVALRYLTDEVGLCPVHLESVKKILAIKGRVMDTKKSKREVYVDIGVYSPKIVDATIFLQHLQAELVDGRKVALKTIAELFGFCENFPLTVRISNVNGENGHVEARLFETQLNQFRNWMESLLDRLIIVGSSMGDIQFTLKKAGLGRDVIDVEPLGLFEFAVVCKLGTDAAGLIPKIGKNLQNATFTVFSPKKILEFLNY